jgi:multicomponent Na+:H+ antiporter subunit D
VALAVGVLSSIAGGGAAIEPREIGRWSLFGLLIPLHLWLPNAYTYAPSVISAFLAATATKVAVYVFLRFVFTVFGKSFAFTQLPLGTVLLPWAILAIVVPSTVAIFQNDIKRMLAYSSLAQIGYMMLGISFASITGLTAGIVHLFNHALMKGGLFLATGCLVLRLGSSQISDLHGVGRKMPWTMFAWVVGGLGLIGVPTTVGFISKWYLIRAAWEDGLAVVSVLVLLSSLLALVYVWRVVEVAYFREPAERHKDLREAPVAMLIPTWALIGATIVFGLAATPTVGVARRAASALLGVEP